VCRSDYPVTRDLKEKIALFTDVDEEAVIPLETARTIYEVPLVLEEVGLGSFITRALDLPAGPACLDSWRALVDAITHPKDEVTIGIVGKYVSLPDAYLSVSEALQHAALYHNRRLDLRWIDSSDLEETARTTLLEGLDGIVVPGGFGHRGVEGKVRAARYARESGTPYLGLCLGMQAAVIELARHVLHSSSPNSTEFNQYTEYPVIDLMHTQRDVSEKGGTMRLGVWPCRLLPGSRAFAAYGQPVIYERHRHRYEFNNEFRELLVSNGLVLSGLSPDNQLVEIVELADHPWFVGTQFHPEFKSRPDRPHPLFRSFIGAAVARRVGTQVVVPAEEWLVTSSQ
jgi:CTP synthase